MSREDPRDVAALEGRDLQGRLPSRPRVGIIGSRRIFDDGESVRAVRVVIESARSSSLGCLPVVSGGALGVDFMAHHVALLMNVPQVAVLPFDRSTPYPKENRTMFSRILDQGGALVHAPPGTKSGKNVFLNRNRVLVGLIDRLVVIAAEPRSGSMHTSRAALRAGIPVAVASLEGGCKELIDNGATFLPACESADGYKYETWFMNQ